MRILPTICVHICSVAQVSRHEASGSAGQHSGRSIASRTRLLLATLIPRLSSTSARRATALSPSHLRRPPCTLPPSCYHQQFADSQEPSACSGTHSLQPPFSPPHRFSPHN